MPNNEIYMVEPKESLSNYVISLLNNGDTRDEIIADLMGKGHDERFVKELVTESANLRSLKRRSQALALILGGAAICLASCIFTITNTFSSASFPWVLYGLTSAGIVVVFAGFTKIF